MLKSVSLDGQVAERILNRGGKVERKHPSFTVFVPCFGVHHRPRSTVFLKY